MKKTRIFAGFVSAVMMSGMASAIPANAVINRTYSSESIAETRAEYSERYQHAPEFIETLGGVAINSDTVINDVYVTKTENNYSYILAEYRYTDTISYGIDADNDTLSAIASEIGTRFNDENAVQILQTGSLIWQDKKTLAVTESPGIVLGFTGNDENANLALADSVSEYLDSEYDLTKANGTFGKYTFSEGYINWNNFTAGTKLIDSKEKVVTLKYLSDDEVSEINAYLADNGINAELANTDNTRIFNWGEDVTDTQRAAVASYMKENWGYQPEIYFLAENGTVNGISAFYDKESELLSGDANCDGNADIADAILILQYLANPEKYPITAQGLLNADIIGNDGVTALDALQIQKLEAGSL
ncbi:MAG: dockerin type I repeat-containing protein [Ruminococcus sp.]|nr:dockerin type I repeat-containing protein [Ruminococcus sp.]